MYLLQTTQEHDRNMTGKDGWHNVAFSGYGNVCSHYRIEVIVIRNVLLFHMLLRYIGEAC